MPPLDLAFRRILDATRRGIDPYDRASPNTGKPAARLRENSNTRSCRLRVRPAAFVSYGDANSTSHDGGGEPDTASGFANRSSSILSTVPSNSTVDAEGSASTSSLPP